jgi:hypothetical protein
MAQNNNTTNNTVNNTVNGGKYITIESFDTYRSTAINKIKTVSEQCGKLKAESFFYKNKYEQLASSILPAQTQTPQNKIDLDLNTMVEQVINDTFNDHLRLLQNQ